MSDAASLSNPASASDSDQMLVERCVAGDQRAFELLVIKYQRRSERLIARMVRDGDLVDDGRVGQRGHVAQLSFLRDVAQESPHDLARSSLWQLGRQDDLTGLRDRTDDLRHVVS